MAGRAARTPPISLRGSKALRDRQNPLYDHIEAINEIMRTYDVTYYGVEYRVNPKR